MRTRFDNVMIFLQYDLHTFAQLYKYCIFVVTVIILKSNVTKSTTKKHACLCVTDSEVMYLCVSAGIRTLSHSSLNSQYIILIE